MTAKKYPAVPGKNAAPYRPLTTISEDEAAAHIGVSVETLREWRLQGGGPVRRSCGNYIPFEVETWAVGHRRSLEYLGRER